jgi:hypothetical protein
MWKAIKPYTIFVEKENVSTKTESLLRLTVLVSSMKRQTGFASWNYSRIHA